MGLHVIILGAGASYTSGYPLADELRLRLSSYEHFVSACEAAADKEKLPLHSPYRESPFGKFQKKMEEAINLFRYGGFATVDEFCKLAKDKRSEDVSKMKSLLRAALLIHNPEAFFVKSDYYSFIQKLFENVTPNLRTDLAILSFNYDCYLEFLLARAYRMRCSCSGVEPPEPSVLNRIIFGLEGQSAKTLPTEGFLLLKVHGTIFPPEGIESFRELIKRDPSATPYSRIQTEIQTPCESIRFPWEIFPAGTEGFDHFGESKESIERVWDYARSLIQHAVKVSFVGLSFHEFLNDGLRKLFSLRENPDIKVVVADTLNKEFDYSGIGKPPSFSPVARCLDVLQQSCPLLKPRGSDSSDNLREHNDPNPWVTPRANFQEFIQREMSVEPTDFR